MLLRGRSLIWGENEDSSFEGVIRAGFSVLDGGLRREWAKNLV